MATVYQALDLRLQRKVALKVMSPELLRDPGMIERFQREAQIIASLHHQHIVPVHSVEHIGDVHFFELRFVEGPTLRAVLEKAGPLPVDVVRAWFAQIAEALDYAHERGVVHRDIKPGNILVELDGTAVLTDFGIAKIEQAPRQTATGLLVGTTTYMSPEQWSGEGIGPSSDQYSLGIVLYEMLTGDVPFSGNMGQLLTSHLSETPTTLTKLRNDCPRDLARAVMRMLEKKPEVRWPSLAEAARGGQAVKPTSSDPIYAELRALAQGEGPERVLLGSGARSTTQSGLRSTTTRIKTAIRARPKTTVGVTALAVALPLALLSMLGPGPRGLDPAAPAGSDESAGLGGPVVDSRTVPALTLSPPMLLLAEGDSASLSPLLLSEGDTVRDPQVTWETAAADVVRVDSLGWVYAVGPGETAVRARSVNSEAWAEASILVGKGAALTEGPGGLGSGDRGSGAATDKEPVDRGAVPASIAAVPDSILLEVGLLQILDPIALDRAGQRVEAPLNVRSENPGVAEVRADANGSAIVGVRAGRTRVLITSGGIARAIPVVVADEPVADVQIDPVRVDLRVGESAVFAARVETARGGTFPGQVTWSSSRPEVAEVGPSGMVEGVGSGETRIVAAAGNRADTAIVSVRVADVPEVSSLSVTAPELFETADGAKSVQTHVVLSRSGGDGSPWCAGVTVRAQKGRTVQQTQNLPQPGSGGVERLEFSTLLERLGLGRGDSYRTDSIDTTVRVWNQTCAANPQEGDALGSASAPTQLCVSKSSRMSRWALCG
jgi:serine/threonine-protein kinase